ncbi:MAG: carboxypeptidase-like regulatory domain-containing protein [Solirubrobacteraceae bacterium]
MASPAANIPSNFSSPSNSGLNYITQYYVQANSPGKAAAVALSYESVALAVNEQMHEGGRIAGDVDDAASGAPISGISVCAYSEQEETLVAPCASTGQTGEYTIAGLPQGEYKVEFAVAPESTLDYVGQFFDKQSSAGSATLVPVAVGKTSAGINAKLQLGGRISGRVNGIGSGPIGNVLVCALRTVSEAVACALTGRNGEYVVLGVPAGSYVIGFDDGNTYAVQYYNDQTVYPDAQKVEVTVGASTTDIDDTLGRRDERVPSGPTPPVASGPPIPHGVTLEEPLTPAPPTPQTPPTSASSQTSTSTAGASTSTPMPAQVAPVIEAPMPKIVISGSTASLLLSCSDATCRGSIELTSQIMTNRHEGGKAASHRETLVLARGYFSLAGGKSAAAVLHLTAQGRLRLARGKASSPCRKSDSVGRGREDVHKVGDGELIESLRHPRLPWFGPA